MIIDTHTHIADPCPRDNAGELKRDCYIRLLDEYGVSKVWISAVAGLYATGDYQSSNRYMYEFTKGHEDRFVPFFTVNPNYGETVLDEIKRCVFEYDMRGMKFSN